MSPSSTLVGDSRVTSTQPKDNSIKKSIEHHWYMQYQLYFTKLGYFTWKVSECEELVGDTHRLVD